MQGRRRGVPRIEHPIRSPREAGGPLKPGFGLSGEVLLLDKVFPPLFRVFVSSISIQSRPSLTAGYWLWISNIPTEAKTWLEWNHRSAAGHAGERLGFLPERPQDD